MRWFGESWGALLLDEIPHRDTPVGEFCVWCLEEIDEDDSGIEYVDGSLAHKECFIRHAIGGVNHQLGRCTCQGGDLPPDPPGLSVRDAAREAVKLYEYRGYG